MDHRVCDTAYPWPVGRATQRRVPAGGITSARFTPDGAWIYFQWLPAGTDWRKAAEPYRVRAVAGAVPEPVSRTHMDSVGPLLEPGPLSRDWLRRVVSYEGDLYLVDLKASQARRLTQTTIIESNPSFSADGRRVFFIRDGANIMALDLR